VSPFGLSEIPEATAGYADYVAAGGIAPEADFPRLYASAERIVRDVTFGRSDSPGTYITDAGALALAEAAIIEAKYRATDALYGIETSVTSEKLGSYSAAYAVTARADDAEHAARTVLRGTGLASAEA